MKNKMNKDTKQKNKKLQKRQIVVTEFEDGSFEFDATSWKIEVKPDEVMEFFEGWKEGLLKEELCFDNRKPKLLDGIEE